MLGYDIENGLCTAKIHKPFYAVKDEIVYSVEIALSKGKVTMIGIVYAPFKAFHSFTFITSYKYHTGLFESDGKIKGEAFLQVGNIIFYAKIGQRIHKS